jgi:hypothetical protein
MSGWACKYSVNDYCELLSKECQPGYPGCVLYGRFVFANKDHPSNKKIEQTKRRLAEKAKESGEES